MLDRQPSHSMLSSQWLELIEPVMRVRLIPHYLQNWQQEIYILYRIIVGIIRIVIMRQISKCTLDGNRMNCENRLLYLPVYHHPKFRVCLYLFWCLLALKFECPNFHHVPDTLCLMLTQIQLVVKVLIGSHPVHIL